jgi:hypothetical protein
MMPPWLDLRARLLATRPLPTKLSGMSLLAASNMELARGGAGGLVCRLPSSS